MIIKYAVELGNGEFSIAPILRDVERTGEALPSTHG